MKEAPRDKASDWAKRIDRTISVIAPGWQARRERARLQLRAMALVGSYIGASKKRRATQEWNPLAGDADADIIYDLATLRVRSRDLLRNAPVACGAVNTTLMNVVGTGLKLQARIDRKALNISDDEADEWEDKTEREWRLFAEARECDCARQLTFAGIQELAFRQTLENGEVFALLPRFKRPGSPYLLKLQLIEADRVGNPNLARNTTTLMEGVEKDERGAPVAYHILDQHPYAPVIDAKKYKWTKVPAFGGASGQPNVIHLYNIQRPGQTRGVPFLAPVIEPLKMLDRYSEAELMAAVISSMFTVFVTTPGGGLPWDNTGLGVETGASAADTDIKLASGNIVGLGKGDDVKFADPKRPNQNFDLFVTAILEQIGTALGIPYEIIIRHFSSSYSASRAALLEAWRFFKNRRVWLAANFCQPVYETWLFEAIAAGRVSAPGFFADDMIRKAYCGTEWVGDAPGYIDPAKDIEAAKERMGAKISTLAEETTLLTGGDTEKKIPQIAREIKHLEKFGMMHPALTEENKQQRAAALLPGKVKAESDDTKEEDDDEDT